MSHSAAQAYGSVAKQIANPRQLEAQLLLKAAARLQAVYEDWDDSPSTLKPALLYNRKLWTILVASVTDPTNPLAKPIRQNVANLGVFILSQTVELALAPRRDGVRPLVSINRELAAGLLGQR